VRLGLFLRFHCSCQCAENIIFGFSLDEQIWNQIQSLDDQLMKARIRPFMLLMSVSVSVWSISIASSIERTVTHMATSDESLRFRSVYSFSSLELAHQWAGVIICAAGWWFSRCARCNFEEQQQQRQKNELLAESTSSKRLHLLKLNREIKQPLLASQVAPAFSPEEN
jgi:hypothetical protein